MAEPKPSPWSGPHMELSGRLPTSPVCPKCGKGLDGFTSAALDGALPKPGNCSICVYCATLLEYYGEPLALRRMEGDALILALADPLVRRIRRWILAKARRREAAPHG